MVTRGQSDFRREFYLADYTLPDGLSLTCQPTKSEVTSYLDMVDAVFRNECGFYSFAVSRDCDADRRRFVLCRRGATIVGGLTLTLGDGACINCFKPLEPKSKLPREQAIFRLGNIIEPSSLVMLHEYRLSPYIIRMLSYIFSYAALMGFDYALLASVTKPTRADLLYIHHGFKPVSEEVFHPGGASGPGDTRPNIRVLIRPLHPKNPVPPSLIKPLDTATPTASADRRRDSISMSGQTSP